MPQFFSPLHAALFALLVPLIIVYFLKLRRTRVAIPSLALWQQVINDQRVNSPFQKFKRNILLLLQILVLSLLVLSAMQPFYPGTEANASKLPILIDCSASMGAKDTNGQSRLDLVKEEVSKIIDGLQPGQQLTLIEVGASARRITDFTDNKVLLRTALADLQVSDVPSRLDDGLRLAQALTRSAPQIESVRLYSDGNLPTKVNPSTGKEVAAVDFDLSFPVDFFQMESAGANMGITAFNARRSTTERWDVFVRVEGSEHGATSGKVILRSNGAVVSQETIVLEPGESQRLVFTVGTNEAHQLEVELQPQEHDSLACDNRAWLTLLEGRDLDVYCPADLATFRHALQSTPGIHLEPDADGASKRGNYDLVISDDLQDRLRPATAYLFVNAVPEDLTSELELRDGEATIVDWKRDANLFQHVQLKEVLISNVAEKREGITDADVEAAGYEILAHANNGPLAIRRSEGLKTTYHLLFDPDRSTLPYRIGFPVMVSNLVNETMQQASLAETRSPTTGILPALQVTKSQTFRITKPDGHHEERESDEEGILLGISAPLVGEYEVREAGELIDQVGLALLNSSETSLKSVDKIQFNEMAIEATGERPTTDQLLWRALAVAALCLLMVEWWYFQKRPAGVPD
ncbi:MAG: BatA and WFA domain-containing protein [Planctomycetaceae bacterium]|nr:BatA and WFA domain-containing protein [Planctomycetaceae bacterium]